MAKFKFTVATNINLSRISEVITVDDAALDGLSKEQHDKHIDALYSSWLAINMNTGIECCDGNEYTFSVSTNVGSTVSETLDLGDILEDLSSDDDLDAALQDALEDWLSVNCSRDWIKIDD